VQQLLRHCYGLLVSLLVLPVSSYAQTSAESLAWHSFTAVPSPTCQQALATYAAAAGDTTYLLTIGGVDVDFRPLTNVWRYNPGTNQWQQRTPLPLVRALPGVATMANRVYVAGGYLSGFSASDRLDIYNPYTNTWSVGPSLLVPVGDCALLAVGDSLLYVIGGTSKTIDQQLVQVYNRRTNRWAMGTPHPGAVGGGIRGASLAGGRLVLAGGYNQTLRQASAQAWLGILDAHDPTLVHWEALPDNPAGAFSRMGASASPLPAQGGQVFFTGGDPTGQGLAVLDRTCMLDVTTRQWLVGPPKPTGVSNLVNLVPVRWQQHVYLAAVGGYDGQNPTKVNEWLRLGPQPQPLPVTLIQFTAALQVDRAVLTWKTAMERTHAAYRVEVSPDGHSFTAVGIVPATSASSTQGRTYQWTDRTTSGEGTRYYRLWQVDTDGQQHLLGTQVLSMPTAPLTLHVYPNPATPATRLTIGQIPAGQWLCVTCTNALGQQRILYEGQSLTPQLELGIDQALPAGLYWICVTTGGQRMQRTYLKK